MKHYDRYVRIGKNIVYTKFCTICDFRHSLEILEHIPHRKGRTTVLLIVLGMASCGQFGEKAKAVACW